MRGVFFKRLIEKMRKDDRLFFLTADTGINLIEPIFEEFPDRAINVGIAEQNLIGVAAGLCNAGYRPVCYAITNFLVHRCLEQLRNDICLHRYPAILVGTSAGYAHGGLWATHYVVDDVGCMKSIPHLNVYSPSSIESMDAIFDEAMTLNHASYIRITKGSPSDGSKVMAPDRFLIETPDSDTLVISHGKMVINTLDAAKIYSKFSLFALDKIKPLNSDLLRKIWPKYKKIVVVEDNFKTGLFNSLCQWAFEEGFQNARIHFVGPQEQFEEKIGDQDWLEDRYGISKEKIASSIKAIQEGRPTLV